MLIQWGIVGVLIVVAFVVTPLIVATSAEPGPFSEAGVAFTSAIFIGAYILLSFIASLIVWSNVGWGAGAIIFSAMLIGIVAGGVSYSYAAKLISV